MPRNTKEGGFPTPGTEPRESHHPNVNDPALGKTLDKYNDYDFSSTSASTVGKKIAGELGLARFMIDGLCEWTRAGDTLDYEPQKAPDGKIRRYLFKDREAFLVFLALEDTLKLMSQGTQRSPDPRALVERTRARLGADPLNDPVKFRDPPFPPSTPTENSEETEEDRRKRGFINWRKEINERIKNMTEWNSLHLGMLLDEMRLGGSDESVPLELRQVLVYLLYCNQQKPFLFEPLEVSLRSDQIIPGILLAREYLQRFPKIANLPQLVRAFEKRLGIDAIIKE